VTARSTLILLVAAAAIASAVLFDRRRMLDHSLDELVETRMKAAAATGDALLATAVDRIRLALERARSRPARGAQAHLALVISDSTLTLERGDIVLRTALAKSDVPRGVHMVALVAADRITLEGGIVLEPNVPGDSVLPAGTIRVQRSDFEAIRPNLRAGHMAYLF